MQLKLTLIRNGKTKSDDEGKYLGIMDEELADEEIQRLQGHLRQGVYPPVEIIYSGTLTRCRQTAQLLYPAQLAVLLKELNPLDLGSFNGKRFHEITRDKQFSDWAKAPGLLPLGNGEKPHAFRARINKAFKGIVEEMSSKGVETAAVITHRIVLEAILQRYIIPRSNYMDWAIPYGGGYFIEYDTVRQAAKVVGKSII